MNTKRNHATRSTVLIGTLLATSFGTLNAGAEVLEEVVARGSRTDVVVEQARFEATMDAYAYSVDAAFKSEMRKHIAEQARPRLRIALAGVSHRG